MFVGLVYLLFFLSGAAALVYQVVWVRSLTLVFGGSHLAVTAVLSIFMGGLAIGSYVVGRRVDRVGKPLRLYGLLELGIEVFGGIDLNRAVGGVNPVAVAHMVIVKGGWGRVVWMPTFDAEHDTLSPDRHRPFVPVSSNGELLPEVKMVIAIVSKHHLTLETGHSSPEEGLMIVREARRQGVQHIVVTHAMLVGMTIPQMQEAARLGAYLEFVYNGLIGQGKKFEMRDYAQAIRAIGPESCILASDLGQAANPLPPDGLSLFFAGLMKEGFSEADIKLMSSTNPARALGLE